MVGTYLPSRYMLNNAHIIPIINTADSAAAAAAAGGVSRSSAAAECFC